MALPLDTGAADWDGSGAYEELGLALNVATVVPPMAYDVGPELAMLPPISSWPRGACSGPRRSFRYR